MADPFSLENVDGIGPTTAVKLRHMGTTTLEALAVTPAREITGKTDTEPEKALLIVLDTIIIARAYNSDHQCFLIDNLLKVSIEEKVKLVVVDPMISHFPGEYVGRENLADRQQRLNQCLHKLLRLAEICNLAVVITSQVQSNPPQRFGDPNRPAGGHITAHACTHRIHLYKGSQGTRVAKVIDGPYLPEETARFLITERGVEDAPGEVERKRNSDVPED